MPAPAPQAETRPARAATRWSARQLLMQPHRLCFSAAALVWAASALWWLLALAWPDAAAAVPATTVHALVFTLGPMPLFFAGFLFTSAPKWLRRPDCDTKPLRPGVAMVVLGWLLLPVVSRWSATAAGLALCLCAVGWALLWGRLVALRRGATRRSRHFDAIAAVCGLIVLALAAAALALLLGRADRAREVARCALWAAVLPVFLLASHRLLPFLSRIDPLQPDASSAPRAAWWLPAVPLAASLLLALSAWPGMPATVVEDAWPLRVALPGAAGVLTLWLALRWSAHPATRSPLLQHLLRAFAWSGAAWLGLAGSALPWLAPPLRAGLDAAALHALTLGFAGGTMLAMVSRLSATQAGRSQAVDRYARVLEAMLQLALVTRLLAALWPAATAQALPLAALLWAVIAAAWLWRHGGQAGRLRAQRQRPMPAESPAAARPASRGGQ
ncbi:MAG: NnrS family protein [Rubrivivax sp.]|nr:NnrS family protein [Rubrivivax sp.]